MTRPDAVWVTGSFVGEMAGTADARADRVEDSGLGRRRPFDDALSDDASPTALWCASTNAIETTCGARCLAHMADGIPPHAPAPRTRPSVTRSTTVSQRPWPVADPGHPPPAGAGVRSEAQERWSGETLQTLREVVGGARAVPMQQGSPRFWQREEWSPRASAVLEALDTDGGPTTLGAGHTRG